MMQKSEWDVGNPEGVGHSSMKTPLSHPNLMSPAVAAGFGRARDTKGRDYRSHPVRADFHLVGKKLLPAKQKKSHVLPDNIFSVDGDPALFNTIKPVLQTTSCHHCGLHGSRRCSQCRQTCYCSVECQRKDWASHSVICKPTSVKNETSCRVPIEAAEKKASPLVEPAVSDLSKRQETEKKIFLCDLQESGIRKGTEIQGFVVEFSNPSYFFIHSYIEKSVKSLFKLTTTLQEIYSKPENLKKGYTPVIGEICVARYSQDQRWYRVLVQNVDAATRKAHVLYIDFGNQEALTLDNLQKMHQDLELLSPLAMKCFLVSVTPPPGGWSPVCIAESRKLMDQQKVSVGIVEVLREEVPCYAVDVCVQASGIHVAKLLLEKGFASAHDGGRILKEKNSEIGPLPVMAIDKAARKEELSDAPESLPRIHVLSGTAVSVGDIFSAVITEIKHPEEFYCQQLQNAEELSKLMESMSKHFAAVPHVPSFTPAVGQVCSAQCAEDRCWYRAKILEKRSQEALLVEYIDFGNVEVLPLSSLRPIQSNMLKLPSQAIKCSLAGVKPRFKRWTGETYAATASLVANDVVTVVVVGQTKTSFVVEVADRHPTGRARKTETSHATPSGKGQSCGVKATGEKWGNKAPQILVVGTKLQAKAVSTSEDGYSVESESSRLATLSKRELQAESCIPCQWKSVEVPLNEPIESRVLSVISPDLFYAFPKENRVDIQKLTQVMVGIAVYCKAEKTKLSYRPSVGDMCCAKYTDDGYWYRAIVLDTSLSTAKVAYADYGNTEDLPFSSLLPITENFLDPPVPIVKCALAGLTPLSEEWSPAATQLLRLLVQEQNIIFTALSVNAGIYSVSVEKRQDTGVVNVAEKLVGDGLARDSRSTGGHCKGKDGCCCCSQDLLKRVKKLEETLRLLLNVEHV
ncbi:tudor domain-containing protein 1-like [Spea bombifrons]|uniref:tudor domain-containing protein 1-like n=1 Tax=Spea bombifrons TaxID=233779 RepID=UPI00234BB56D|nr:tudor domain-containing protein 1-like [Spea bombifrons]